MQSVSAESRAAIAAGQSDKSVQAGQPITGAEIVVRCLAEEGVEHVFGYPGGAVLYIYDEIFKQDKFQHILVRHEQAAVHAADAYSRSSNKIGVCIVTSGPGVTNAVTGIATAYMDSIPMVIITGQVPTHAIGQDAFQECDTVGITRPCVKHNILVKDIKDLAPAIRTAFFIAQTGRPGPVLVDIPKDITIAKAPFAYQRDMAMRSYNPVVKGHAGQIKKAVQLLLQSQGTVGIPALKILRAVPIQPGTPTAAQPTAKKGVGERSRQGTVA
jgi:acetolactate synthase-1/2/3 large subunit